MTTASGKAEAEEGGTKVVRAIEGAGWRRDEAVSERGCDVGERLKEEGLEGGGAKPEGRISVGCGGGEESNLACIL